MRGVSLLSPAKINLFLEVLGKRRDGYHEIRTILALIELSDEVYIEPKSSGLEVACSDSRVPNGPENLAYKAAEVLFQEKGLSRKGLSIFINKRIPVGGGLGGGSSNAAATLWGINLLFNLGMGIMELQELGACLGSDVPFFFTEGVAIAEGRGEVLTPLPPLPPLWVVLVNPGIEVSTAWAYERAKIELTSLRSDINIKNLVYREGFSGILERAYNSLEEGVFERYPILAEIKDSLLSFGARPALMAGSGATIFGAFSREEIARQCMDYFSRKGYFTVFTRVLNNNPILSGGKKWK